MDHLHQVPHWLRVVWRHCSPKNYYYWNDSLSYYYYYSDSFTIVKTTTTNMKFLTKITTTIGVIDIANFATVDSYIKPIDSFVTKDKYFVEWIASRIGFS